MNHHINTIMPTSVLLTLMLLMIRAAPATDVIINSSGEGGKGDSLFKGEIQASESGFLVYVSGNWEQNGANTGSESIWTFLDDYTPAVSGGGSNNVKCTYHQCGWFIGFGGPDAKDNIDFYTLTEIQNKVYADQGDFTLNSVPKSGYTSPVDGTVSISITGTVGTAWNTTATNTYSTSFTGTLNGSSTVGGTITIKSLELTGSSTSGWSTSIQETITTSYAHQTSGSSSTSVTFSQSLPVQAGQTVLLAEVTKCKDALVTVQFFPDANKNGIADNGQATSTATATLRSEPYIVYTPSIQ